MATRLLIGPFVQGSSILLANFRLRTSLAAFDIGDVAKIVRFAKLVLIFFLENGQSRRHKTFPLSV